MESSNCKKRCMRDDEAERESCDVGREQLPGFRFHPTDEELVGFYLKRKVEKRLLPLSFQIIKQVDIYKHDPWDLSKYSSSKVGDKEWYFYCKRGRKYRNSIRPNRVTGSGFWKATGIDRPIYSNGWEGHQCIGLKKSLVYYRGSAGKGSKTDWMMHEFRLPSENNQQHHQHILLLPNQKDNAQEAEIWTLCRIFKRHKKHAPDWRELSGRKNNMNTSSKTSSIDSNTNHEHYISFSTPPESKPNKNDHNALRTTNANDHNSVLENLNIVVDSNQKITYFHGEEHQQKRSSMTYAPPSTASYSSSLNLLADDKNDLQSFTYYEECNGWDDLSSVVEFAVRTPIL